MLKRRPHLKRKPIYWWSQNIADIRRKRRSKRRILTRVSYKGNMAIIATAWLENQTIRKKLKSTMKQAK